MSDDRETGILLLGLLLLLGGKKKQGEGEPLDMPPAIYEPSRADMLEPYDPSAEAIVFGAGEDWVFPVPWMYLPEGSQYVPEVTDKFGTDRDGGKRKHKGVDIMYRRVAGKPPRKTGDHGTKLFWAPPGTPVVAARAGVVAAVGKDSHGGKVLIGHGSPSDMGGKKVATWYRHMETVTVKKGDKVTAGQPLGTMGWDPSGNQKARHLHFEVWVAGSAWDPVTQLDMNKWGRKTWTPKAITTS